MHHQRRDTLSRTWNFAKASSAPRTERASAEVDRFFVCLDDQDTSAEEDVTVVRPSAGFGGFGAPLDDEDDMPPFVLPTQRDGPAKFSVVHDTYDDEDDGINFVIPVSVPELKPSFKPAPMTFSFPRRVVSKTATQNIHHSPPVLKARTALTQRW